MKAGDALVRQSHAMLVLACALAVALAFRAPALAESGPKGRGPAGAGASAGVVPAGSAPGGSASRNAHAVPASARPPGAFAGDGGPSDIIFPPQTLGVRFDHKLHLGLGTTCATCHEAARTSKKSADSLLPRGTRCDGCHGTNHREREVQEGPAPLGACATCHEGYREGDGQRVARLVVPPPRLRFDHALHAARGIDCKKCHGDLSKVTQATADQLPRMRGCFDCHRHEGARPGVPSRACPTCHLTQEDGTLRTRFPEGDLLPPAWLRDAEHGPDFIERHKRIAGNDSRFCANCHTERFCTGCHDGRVRPRRIHPNDFLSLHAVEATRNATRCTSCHQQQSFCTGCHQRSGVSQSGPLENLEKRGRFHLARSVFTDGPRGPRHHAVEAQKNLSACVSCHTERDCATCHATAGVGGGGLASPHPPGFSGRCARVLRQNARSCLVCHDPGDRSLGACR